MIYYDEKYCLKMLIKMAMSNIILLHKSCYVRTCLIILFKTEGSLKMWILNIMFYLLPLNHIQDIKKRRTISGKDSDSVENRRKNMFFLLFSIL